MSAAFLFAGDSITASDRLWLPETEGLGNGYVSMLAPQLKQRFPGAAIYNKGFDGFTVPALIRRLKQDGIPKNTKWVTVLIGINDIGVAMNTGVSLSQLQFAKHYRQLLSEITQYPSARILCVGPFLFPHPQEFINWIPLLRETEKIITDITDEMNLSFLPLHDTLNEFAADRGYHAITTDGIHLTALGHQFLASMLLPYYTA
ncbi:MAG: GDSL-type esterase/lipase family protein [Eubacteriales bacterium]|nr:GDSL-type esterase/lipase family protein [Eubacteriales bacterium]